MLLCKCCLCLSWAEFLLRAIGNDPESPWLLRSTISLSVRGLVTSVPCNTCSHFQIQGAGGFSDFCAPGVSPAEDVTQEKSGKQAGPTKGWMTRTEGPLSQQSPWSPCRVRMSLRVGRHPTNPEQHSNSIMATCELFCVPLRSSDPSRFISVLCSFIFSGTDWIYFSCLTQSFFHSLFFL